MAQIKTNSENIDWIYRINRINRIMGGFRTDPSDPNNPSNSNDLEPATAASGGPNPKRRVAARTPPQAQNAPNDLTQKLSIELFLLLTSNLEPRTLNLDKAVKIPKNVIPSAARDLF